MSKNNRELPRVGYWWSEKKSKKALFQNCVQTCRNYGLEFVKLDFEEPLEDQGPFVAIVHKLLDTVVKAEKGDGKASRVSEEFRTYLKNHPEVIVIDELPSVEKLLDRFRGYSLVDRALKKHGGAIIPCFVELTTKNMSENVEKMRAANVGFPCVCKSTVAQISTVAHEMCLIFNEEGLKDVNPPCIVQQFINHNAVLYKLYIVGNKYFVMERSSLKNFFPSDHNTIFFYSHTISKPNSASVLTELEIDEKTPETIPPEIEKLDHIVQALCQHIRLTLVGVDVIISNDTGEYAVVDINVFPGYDGVDNFFPILCDVILQRIALRAKGISSIVYKPTLANVSPFPAIISNSLCKSAMLPSNGADIPPHSYKCICCPTKGACSNSLLEVPVEGNLDLHARHIDMKYVDPKGRVFGLSEKNSSYTVQDDSGFETSDSCDEKKKPSVMRSMKRQHSKTSGIVFNTGETA